MENTICQTPWCHFSYWWDRQPKIVQNLVIFAISASVIASGFALSQVLGSNEPEWIWFIAG